MRETYKTFEVQEAGRPPYSDLKAANESLPASSASTAVRQETESVSGSTGKIKNVALWVLQIAAAGMFLMTGFMKLSGNPQMIGLFEAIGFGEWFRYLTGALEVAGAAFLLIPRASGLAAIMLAGVMVGAVMTHLLLIGGSPIMATILLVIMGVVAWGRRERTMNLFAGSYIGRMLSEITNRRH